MTQPIEGKDNDDQPPDKNEVRKLKTGNRRHQNANVKRNTRSSSTKNPKDNKPHSRVDDVSTASSSSDLSGGEDNGERQRLANKKNSSDLSDKQSRSNKRNSSRNNGSKKKQNNNKNGKNRSNKRNNSNNKKKANTTDMSSYFVAMDCEMVGVGEEGRTSMLARCTIVNWFGQVVFDTYVRPSEPVTDYRTHVSGITAQHLVQTKDNTVMTLDECRTHVSQILENRILIGHALKNDLKVLDLSHPWHLIRDTAKYEPFMKVRFDDGVLWPRKLKDLVYENLQMEIQQPNVPHSPYEDAVAALALYQHVQAQWENVMHYKMERTFAIEYQQQQQQQYQNKQQSEMVEVTPTSPIANPVSVH